jgi:hypothetical protein
MECKLNCVSALTKYFMRPVSQILIRPKEKPAIRPLIAGFSLELLSKSMGFQGCGNTSVLAAELCGRILRAFPFIIGSFVV